MANGTKGDMYTKETLQRILDDGCMDINPRPHYEDIYDGAVYDMDTNTIITASNEVIELQSNQTAFQQDGRVILWTPAHTLSVNHVWHTYDLSKGESPIITLRPIAIRSAIGEMLWIYQDKSNNLDLLAEKYGVTWWDAWDIGDRTIGSVYGGTVGPLNLTDKILLDGIAQNPDSRYHILNLWQYERFEYPYGLKPCAYETQWNVRHGRDGIDYLDMKLVQRSSDFAVAGCINQVQYLALMLMVARHHGYTPGRFTWDATNVQIYDRHIEQAKELISRESIDCNPQLVLNPEKKNFYDVTVDDFSIQGYPKKLVKEKNPQLKFPLGI